jgi:multidrug transporter EmrE-like cation transporter
VTSYFVLGGAIVCEVIGTLLLPATQNFTRIVPTVTMILCYAIAFYCLTFAIREIPIAIVYAIWSGIGVFLIAVFSAFFYKQLLQWQAIVGLALIVSGVVLVNLFSSSHSG